MTHSPFGQSAGNWEIGIDLVMWRTATKPACDVGRDILSVALAPTRLCRTPFAPGTLLYYCSRRRNHHLSRNQILPCFASYTYTACSSLHSSTCIQPLSHRHGHLQGRRIAPFPDLPLRPRILLFGCHPGHLLLLPFCACRQKHPDPNMGEGCRGAFRRRRPLPDLRRCSDMLSWGCTNLRIPGTGTCSSFVTCFWRVD